MTFRYRRLSVERLGAREMFAASPIILEAESGVLVSPMAPHVKADGSVYVSSSKDEKGSLTLTVNIEQAGEYTLSGLTKGLSGSADSFYLSIDGGKNKTWVVPITSKLAWTDYEPSLKLSAGVHTIKISSREKGTELDKIKLTLDGTTNPPPAALPTLSISGATIAEGNAGSKSASFAVKLSSASTKPVTVVYSSADGTAKSGSDYSGISGTLTFAAGETSKVLAVQVLGDTTVESDEQFKVVLSGPVNATLSTSTATGTILNDDAVVDPDPTDLDPNKAPGQNFDLSNWKITLPVNSSGTLGGSAREYDPIPTTLQVKDYFYTAADGAMVFNAPVLGATTGGSKYARSELRELDDSGELAAWSVAEGGRLEATLAVNVLPTATTGISRVVVGQIHGPDDELCRLYFTAGGKLSYSNDKSGSGNKELSFDLKDSQGRVSAIPLNAKFDYSIVVANGKLIVSAAYGGVTYSASETISAFWLGSSMDLYFKAGMYTQVGKPGSGAGSTGSGTGTASFYDLNVSH